ncbi:copper-binding protein [Nostoc minutum NIES-26]|uniref:Copper-binding protein n=1 Tax=Nostoc minutum NIES-26 TaxID=1844469 RepID=A0A367RZ36_9NOSO|nr:cupredoxin domain-containing protein [Dendronalium sp. ChiSLP03b]MDZ8205839.1 cupredoxin domain-containing protein [Dendronalium sp. ChiSLP03b]RCJ41259.1 copper-binding protein [Nostoc minutum NIES-26]
MTWLVKTINNYLYQFFLDWLQPLRHIYLILYLLLYMAFISTTPAMAANLSGGLLKQPATEITVSLSNSANELKFEPNHLELVAGKRYQLRLTNPSQLKHYFTAKDFADGIWTQKVEAGKVEIKGAIHELELKPGAEAEWVFVPLKSGKYSLRCPIPGHTEAGMTGEIVVSN